MVLGLALFATMATAQTNDMRALKDTKVHKDIVQRVERPAVDYKASIFTKSVGDTITGGFWDFSNTSSMVYGQQGTIGQNESVYMQNADNNYNWESVDLLPHTMSSDAAVFTLISDTSYIRSHAAIYTGIEMSSFLRALANYVGNNPCMLIFPNAATVQSGLQHSAYLQMPAVNNPSVGGLYEVRFRQYYVKYSDYDYIDFKVGNDWYAVEVNVRGVDVSVNGQAAVFATYTMPAIFGQQSSLQIRFRMQDQGVANQGYGYWWALDNVAIVESQSNHWFASSEQYVDGGYGTIPVGFNVPLSWYGMVTNDGTDTIASARATVYHQAPGASTFTALTHKDAANLFPNVSVQHILSINERSWYDSINYPGWFGMARNYDDTTNSVTLPASYTKKGLPTEEIGLNKITVTGTVNGSTLYDDIEFDTIGYRVVDISGGEGTNLIEGYRWAHDNGIIPAGSIYSAGNYVVGTTVFNTPTEGNYMNAQYMVCVRYTTPDVIPTDDEGNPWVIRGMEIVPRTDTASAAMVNDRIIPMLGREVYIDSSDGNQYVSVHFSGSEVTGLDNNYVYTVTANDINSINDAGSGYIAPGQPYNAVNIRYSSQPAILPNTAYVVGYQMAQDGWFAAAEHLYGYRNSAGNSTRYNADPDLIDYYHQFTPYSYDVRVNDAVFRASSSTNWPLIRFIVGPRETLDTNYVSVICSESDTNFAIGTRNSDGMIVNSCGTQVPVIENSDATFYVFGTGDSTSLHPGIIDEIIIDGRHINVGNEDDFYGDDYSIIEMDDVLRNEDGDILLPRSYYIVTLIGVNTDTRTISAAGHAYPFNLGIESEAVNVALGLQPNPATSTVSINMRGVTGMVDCSIIDMSGRVVYSRTINAESSHTIDLSNIAAGAYFVRVTNDQFSKVEKLIVR